MSETSDPISVSTLRAELTALELRIVDRLTGALASKADAVHLEQVETRVASLELSRASRETMPSSLLEMQRDIGDLKRFRYSMPSLALLAFLVSLATLAYFVFAS